MIQGRRFLTVDNISRVGIMWTYLLALLALWFRLEIVASEAKRASEAADMAIEMHGRTRHPLQ